MKLVLLLVCEHRLPTFARSATLTGSRGVSVKPYSFHYFLFLTKAYSGQRLHPRRAQPANLFEEVEPTRNICHGFAVTEERTKRSSVLDGLVRPLRAEWKHLQLLGKTFEPASSNKVGAVNNTYWMSGISNQDHFPSMPSRERIMVGKRPHSDFRGRTVFDLLSV